MVKNIQNIFESITPENIKNIPVIAHAMEVFIETLEDLSKESIDIKNIYENETIKAELTKIYLDDLYNVLKTVEANKELIDSIDKVNAVYNPSGMDPSDDDFVSYINRDAIVNISRYIDDEQFLTFKSYKEHKGTTIAIKYIYELINTFTNSGFAENVFRIAGGDNPFELDIQGSLPAEFYEYIIYPLAHPLGFTYIYSRLITATLEDYFPELSIVYDVDLLRVVCLQTDGSIIYTDFIDKDAGLTTLEVTAIESYISGTSRIKEIYLSNGNYLQQTTTSLGQTSVLMYNSSDEIIAEFTGQCSIEIDYTYIVNTTVQDEITNIQTRPEHDNYSRLNHRNKIILIGGSDLGIDWTIDSFNIGGEDDLHASEIGYNENLDQDGNYLDPPSAVNGRWENYFAPTPDADLKLLLGKIELDYEYYDGTTLVHTQPIKYTDVVDPAYAVLDWVPTVETYEKQNLNNGDYFAFELLIDEQNTNLSRNETLIEPIYSGNDFIDYNGVNQGSIPGFVVGAYDNQQLMPGAINPNLVVPLVSTDVHGEGVNLQYNTYDAMNFTTGFPLLDSFAEDQTEEDYFAMYNILSDTIGDFTEVTSVFNSYLMEDTIGDFSETQILVYSSSLEDTFADFTESTSLDYSYLFTDTFEDDQAITENTVFKEIFTNLEETHTELDSSELWIDTIGEYQTIGDGWIGYKTKDVVTLGESYTSLGIFDQNSDDNFDFGVFRGGIRLEDNNVSAV